MNVETMGYTLTDVAPAGHINEGMTVLQRMEKYGIDSTQRVAYNQLLGKERAEALAAGLAPEIPITEEAARVFSTEIEAQQRAKQMQFAMLAGGAVLVLFMLTRKKGRR